MNRLSDIRHRNLLALIEEAGSAAKLAERTGLAPAYISQMKNRTLTAAGSPRGIGHDAARKLEAGMGKPEGWLDHADLDPLERDLLAVFRALSDEGQEFLVARARAIKSLESSSD